MLTTRRGKRPTAPDVQHAEALLTTGALQSAIFNSANFSSIATDAKGVIQIFNVGAERMLGYTAAEVMNKITPADISDAQELVDRARALSIELGTEIQPGFEALVFKASRGIEDIYELTYIRKDGSRFPAMVSVTALRDAQDAIIGYLLIGTDNTARKQIEDERMRLDQALQQKNAELEDASRMKSEFLANMSHELRTPLNAIIGFSEVLGDGLLGDLTDKQRKFIDDIFKSGKHLLSLINDILDLSKVEAGKMLLDLDAVDISSLLRNSLSIIKGQAAARHVRLDMHAPDRLGFMSADARKVKQIIYNLLSNAVKFTADGGQVTLRADTVPRAAVGVDSGRGPRLTFPLADSPFAEFLEVSVTDNGMGISAEGIKQLFKPFSQVDSGLARKFEGSGLGLALVKLLVDLHGGTVAVESTPGRGSCFTVWIPMRAPEAAENSQPRMPTPRSERINGSRAALVVESNYKSADVIRVQLEAEGFKVFHAATAEAAMTIAERVPLAVITFDIMMPGVDGWTFINRLRELPATKLVPVVIISILADRTKGFALGAAAVMQSPVSRQELSDCLVELGLSPVSEERPIKVLIVDDDPKALEIVAVRIQGLANTVLRAYGGREAIAIAKRELPDLIVLDLLMPDVNGFEVVAALNENAATAHIPIVVVTASDINEDDRKRLNGFVTTIMGKAGFDGKRFMGEVRRAMANRVVVA